MPKRKRKLADPAQYARGWAVNAGGNAYLWRDCQVHYGTASTRAFWDTEADARAAMARYMRMDLL